MGNRLAYEYVCRCCLFGVSKISSMILAMCRSEKLHREHELTEEWGSQQDGLKRQRFHAGRKINFSQMIFLHFDYLTASVMRSR